MAVTRSVRKQTLVSRRELWKRKAMDTPNGKHHPQCEGANVRLEIRLERRPQTPWLSAFRIVRRIILTADSGGQPAFFRYRGRLQQRLGKIIKLVQIVVLATIIHRQARAQEATYEHLCERARALAASPYRPPTNTVPEGLRKLSYTQHSAIRFRSEKALWHAQDLPFQVEFFHPGYIQQDLVTIREADGKEVRTIPFSTELFSYESVPEGLDRLAGFAGYRIVDRRNRFGEVASFLGASYFRMIGRGQTFGSSARGLALNTSKLGTEEFPVFREFELRRPSAADTRMDILALMDSPSVTGAFEFVISAGVTTVAGVNATFFPRSEVKEFGIAPLTSMFLHDQNSHPAYQDFRPEVHDADGLLLQTGAGQWLWRPLEKGRMMRINAFGDENPKGFGLLQRDREFEHYQDLVARFELRPSVWVRPRGNWGRGAVELIQLPSHLEFTDNVVAFWVPERAPKPGEALAVAYDLEWCTNQVVPETLGRVRSTSVGDVVVEPPKEHPNLRFVVEFEGNNLPRLDSEERLRPEIVCGQGTELVNEALIRNNLSNTWRLVIEITRPTVAVDLRARLKFREQPITETWVTTWQP